MNENQQNQPSAKESIAWHEDNNILNNIKISFDAWWNTDGSVVRQIPYEETHDFIRRITKIAWFGGACKAVELTKDL